MGIPLAVGVLGAATAYSGYTQNVNARKARRSAEAQAAIEREQIAELQAEKDPVMPLADDEASKAARRRSIIAQRRRRGRASTILTADGGTPGGDALGA